MTFESPRGNINIKDIIQQKNTTSTECWSHRNKLLGGTNTGKL